MAQTYRYPEGDVYEGDWSKEGKKHGIGRITFNDGSMYEGRFMNGFFSGYGTLRLADGTVYTGNIKDSYNINIGSICMFDSFSIFVKTLSSIVWNLFSLSNIEHSIL